MNKNKKLIVINSEVNYIKYWQELWDYKELLYILAKRDIAVRYKQTIIGIAWSILQPLMTLIVFTVVFNKIAKLPSAGDAPYALMVYIALIPWQFFSISLSSSSSSLVENSNLINKVYFPRLIIPMSTSSVSLIDLIINLAVLGLMLVWFSYMPSSNIVYLPLMIIMVFFASLGPGLWISSMNVKYRDFRYVIPFILQLGIYVSPVGFTSKVIPEKWQLLYFLNPMSGVIEGFRWCILGESSPINLKGYLISWLVICIFLIIGIRRFQKSERGFADNI